MSRKRSVPIDGLQPGAVQVNRRAAGPIPAWARVRIDSLRQSLSTRRNLSSRRSPQHQPWGTPSRVARSPRSVGLSESELSRNSVLRNGWMVSSTGSITSGLATSQERSGRRECIQSRGSPAPIADTPLRSPNEREHQPSFSSIPPELRPMQRPPEVMTDTSVESGRVEDPEDSLPQEPSFSFLPPQLGLTQRSPEVIHFPEVMTDADIESGRLRRYSREDAPEDTLPQQPSFSFLPPDLRQRQVPEEDLTMNENHSGDVDSGTGLMMNDGRRKYRNRCHVLEFLLLVGMAIGVGVGVSQKNKNDSSAIAIDSSTKPVQCNYTGLEANEMIPNVFVQCYCDGNVTIWTDDMSTQYSDLRDSFILTILPDFDEEEQSCDPTNTALWQLANDTLFNVTATDARYLMTLLYANWEGERWRRKKDWLSVEKPECEWQGVECDAENQVKSLFLSLNNMGGTIPSELALLTGLHIVDLGSNRLGGSLPLELFQLQRIERLLLSVNFLNGTIPSQISLLPIIDTIGLDFNYLSGTIPKEMGVMQSLKLLDIGQNSITGEVPPEFGQLVRLESLRFEENALTGTLPPELGQLLNLKTLAGGWNFFRGRLPTQIGNLNLLRSLDLPGVGIAGDIPTELGRCTNLSIISLASNSFVGTLPTEIMNLTRLSFVHLSDNDLSGAIPTELGRWSNLSVLELDGNIFEGPLPSEIGFLKLLGELNLGALHLTGSTPEQVCALRDGALHTFIAPCETDRFQCSVPDCCTECEP